MEYKVHLMKSLKDISALCGQKNGKIHTYSGSITCQKCIKMWGEADEIRTTVETMHHVKQPRRD